MRALLLVWLLLPAVSFAQGYQTTDDIARLLTMNRRTTTFFWASGRQRAMLQLDTMATTGDNLSQKAAFYLMQHDYETGVALLEQSTQLDPKQHRTAARTYLAMLHDYPRALRHLNAFDDLTPNFDDSDGIYPVSYLKGLAYRGMGNHTEAVRMFSIGIDSLARKHGAEWVNYKQYVSRAIGYLALRQPDNALADLAQATKNTTSPSPLVLFYQGKAYLQLNRPADARQAFENALFFWQANRVRGISQPEDGNNPVTEQAIEDALKP